ncbi:MAG: glycosyltransferase [Lachnospiraceae bacterium]|nr:glycosyltransferase [Lachnospiraceae bacterium]
MKILYLFNRGLMTPDLAMSLIMAGHQVEMIDNYECSYVIDDEVCRNKITEAVLNAEKEQPYDFVISYNYVPSAAYVCNTFGLLYISWMYDSWQPTLYSETIMLPCNRIFVFDSTEYKYIKGMGVEHVYLMPLAVNDDRLSEMDLSDVDNRYSCEISLLGKLYCAESVNGYNAMKMSLEDNIRYKIDEIIQNTAGSWREGTNWFDELKELDYAKIPNVDAADERKKCLLTDDIYYASICFGRAITQMDRTMICNSLATKYKTRIYTYEKPVGLIPEVEVHNGVDYMEEMPKVFFNSKINLNISLRSIFTGIPLRAFDVMGSGGFLMSNRQKDMDGLFIDGVDYVAFDSIEDLVDKVEYYLHHEDERIKILVHGYRKVCSYHTYQHRINEILNICGMG